MSLKKFGAAMLAACALAGCDMPSQDSRKIAEAHVQSHEVKSGELGTTLGQGDTRVFVDKIETVFSAAKDEHGNPVLQEKKCGRFVEISGKLGNVTSFHDTACVLQFTWTNRQPSDLSQR